MRFIATSVFWLLTAASALAQGYGVVPNVIFPPMVNGWHVFAPVTGTGSCAAGTYTGTCILYNTNADLGVGVAGCIPQAPPLTDTPATSVQCDSRTAIQTAINKMRDGKPDWFLFKKGDVWTNFPGFGSFSAGSNHLGGQPCSTIYSYNRSVVGSGCSTGLTCATPAVLGSWPSTPGARPLLLNTNGAFTITVNRAPGGNNLAVVGLNLNDYTRDPNNPNFITQPAGTASIGYTTQSQVSCLLLEDNEISWYGGNIAIDTLQHYPLWFQTGVYLYRNVINNAYTNGRGQGIFAGALCNPTFDQNVFFHNGIPPFANFTGSISGTTLTVTALSATTATNVFALNQLITGGGGGGASAGTKITAYLDVNADGTGTYTVNNSQSVSSGAMVAQLAGTTSVIDSSNHSLYWDETGCYGTFSNNIHAQGSTDIQMRAGGRYYNNFGENNVNDIATNSNTQPGISIVDSGVFLNGRAGNTGPIEVVGNLSTSISNFTGLAVPAVTTFTKVTNNIVANAATGASAIKLDQTAQGIAPVANAIVTGNIIYNWGTTNAVTNNRGGILTRLSNGLDPTITNAGSGYPPGFYYYIPMTGGTGSGAFANIRVAANGTVSAIALQNTSEQWQYSQTGQGYQVGDVLKPLSGFTANLLGSLQITVTEVAQITGSISGYTISGGIGTATDAYKRGTDIPLGYVSGSLQGGNALAIITTDANGNANGVSIDQTNSTYTHNEAIINAKIDNGSGAPGTLLTVNSVTSGSVVTGGTRYVYGADIAGSTRINSGSGPYNLINGNCTAKIDDGMGGAGTTLTVTLSTCDGAYPQVGQVVTGALVSANTTISSGSNGSYVVNNSQLVAIAESMAFATPQLVASETMATGFATGPAVTVGSGFAVGDSISPLSGNRYLGGAGSGLAIQVNSVAENCIANANNCNTGNTICPSGVGSCTPAASFPTPNNATVANYNTAVLGTGTTLATCTGSSISGYTLTTGSCSGTAVAINQMPTGTGVTPGTIILDGSGSTWTVNNSQSVSGTITTQNADFYTCALNNRKDAWDSRCTAPAINNWVRDQFGQPHVN